MHCALLHNITSGLGTSFPFLLWHGTPFDFARTSLPPFGSIVAAHYPLDSQTALGGRSQEAIFSGIAPTYACGITLFNLLTKRT